MSCARPTRLRFGPFEADLDLRELYENGEKVPMQGKPFQFLAVLLRQYGEVVSREAISHSLWPDIYVQVNQGINAAARKVRKTLKDDALNPKFIETLGRRGYRFIHPAEVTRWSTDVAEVPDAPVRMAVLPLKFDRAENAAIAGGLTLELVTHLGSIHPRLIVVPGLQICELPEGNDDLAARFWKFDVQYVLAGSLTVRTGRSELRSTLTNTSNGQQCWEKKYEEDGQDLTRIQDEIAVQVVHSFQSLPEGIAPSPLQKTDSGAYQQYLQGRYSRSKSTAADLRNAIASFKNVTERDLRFAPAFTALAEAYNFVADRGLMVPIAAYRLSAQAAKRALEIDPDSTDALIALGWSELAGQRDWAIATRLFERALQLNPNAVQGYSNYACLLLSRGRTEDGVAALEKAREIDPNSLSVSNHLAATYYYIRRFDNAIKQARHSLELDPTSSDAWSCIGLSYVAQRRYGEALEHLQNAVDHSPGNFVTTAQLAYAQAEAGRFPVAESLVQKIESQTAQTASPAYHIALVRLALGSVNEAFQWLDLASQQRSHWILLMSLDPRLDILRGTRKFDLLCRNLRPAETGRVANSAS